MNNELKEFFAAARAFAANRFWVLKTSETIGTATMKTNHDTIYQEEISELEQWAQSHSAKFGIVAKSNKITVEFIHVPAAFRHE